MKLPGATGKMHYSPVIRSPLHPFSGKQKFSASFQNAPAAHQKPLDYEVKQLLKKVYV
jgi:hypothetical protein